MLKVAPDNVSLESMIEEYTASSDRRQITSLASKTSLPNLTCPIRSSRMAAEDDLLAELARVNAPINSFSTRHQDSFQEFGLSRRYDRH